MEKRISNLVRQEVRYGGKVSSENHYRTATPTPKLKLLLFAISAQQKYSYIFIVLPCVFSQFAYFHGPASRVGRSSEKRSGLVGNRKQA